MTDGPTTLLTDSQDPLCGKGPITPVGTSGHPRVPSWGPELVCNMSCTLLPVTSYYVPVPTETSYTQGPDEILPLPWRLPWDLGQQRVATHVSDGGPLRAPFASRDAPDSCRGGRILPLTSNDLGRTSGLP